jgi:hypothetical protein
MIEEEGILRFSVLTGVMASGEIVFMGVEM